MYYIWICFVSLKTFRIYIKGRISPLRWWLDYWLDNLGVESYKSQIDSHCVFSSLHAQHLFRSGVPLYQTSSLPVTHTILHLYFLTHWLGAVTLTLRQGLTSPCLLHSNHLLSNSQFNRPKNTHLYITPENATHKQRDPAPRSLDWEVKGTEIKFWWMNIYTLRGYSLRL